MIKEFELYHGAALSKIAQDDTRTLINSFPTASRCTYLINDSIGLYIKHSTKRLTPWGFSFTKQHQDELKFMADSLSKVFIAFICGPDGIACLSYGELKNVLDEIHEDCEWVRISRGPREKYAISGSDGRLRFKIAHNYFPGKLFSSE